LEMQDIELVLFGIAFQTNRIIMMEVILNQRQSIGKTSESGMNVEGSVDIPLM